MRCDIIAEGIVAAAKELKIAVPLGFMSFMGIKL